MASRGTAFAALLSGLVLLVPTGAQAQQFPARPVRFVIPFPPGGTTDILGRLIATRMQDTWRQPVVVENRPGAGNVAGTDAVAKSAPDGYTMGFVITSHVINPSLRSDLPYEAS